MATDNRILARLARQARTGRRGTFIVLVVGMLALMTIVAVVYFSIGQSDARASAALVSSTRRNDFPDAVAEHIKKILADDITDSFNSGTGTVREAWDYPYTHPKYRTNAASADERFDPAGKHGDDPYLRSSEPTFIGEEPAGMFPHPDREFPNDPTRWFLDNTGWLNITNIAPDGNYVNLYNLREYGIGATPAQMRESLTVFDENGDPTDRLVNGEQLNPTIPFHLSFKQRWAFRPAFDDRPFNDSNYLLYQWADTDGDGFTDARWQELVNASNPANPVYAVPNDSSMRYFVAASIVDLSGRVNVNTATETVAGPTDETPAGLFPSDVDLRGLLTLQDAFDLYADAFGDSIGTAGSGDYRIWNPDATNDVQNYRDAGATNSVNVGLMGYNALRITIEAREVPAPRVRLDQFVNGMRLPVYDTDNEGNRVFPDANERALSYERVGAGSSGATSFGSEFQLSGGFGLSDLAELLTYRVANDPQQLSTLESAVGGRYPDSPNDSNFTRRYSPLRDNRDLAYERPLISVLPGDADKVEAMRLTFATDVRQRLTTLSGARPIRPGPSNAAFLQTNRDNSTYDFSLDLNALLASRDANRIFRGYADALLPLSSLRESWDRSNADFEELRFLSYGYDGPELAIRLAAHLTANLMALTGRDGDGTETQNDTTPAPYTVIINDQARDSLDADVSSGSVGSRTFRQGWWATDRRLDLGEGRIANAANTTQADAVTVFAVKPQPVITQATAYTIYVDAPTTLGGDDEFGDAGGSDGGVPPMSVRAMVTIKGDTVWGTNPDYLGQVLAIQLTNPFNVDIPLTSSDLTNETQNIGPTDKRFTYYLEFGGKHYKLVDVDPQTGDQFPVVLKAGESRNFVILDNSYTAMQQRWTAVAQAFDPTEPQPVDLLRRWLNQQLQIPSKIDASAFLTPALIPELTPSDGSFTVPTAGHQIFSTTDAQNRVVKLWRVMTTGSSDDNFENGSGTNAVQNDYLVDRLRDPTTGGTAQLLRKLRDGKNEIRDTDAGPESLPPGSGALDNKGYTLVLHAAIRRPDSGTSGDTGLPAYMLEVKDRATSKNVEFQDRITSLNGVAKRHFDNDRVGYETIGRFLSETLAGGDDVIVPEAKQRASEKTGHGIGNNLSNQNYASVVAELPTGLDSRFTNRALRPGDLLIPLAVGPWVEMVESSPLNGDDDDRWTTLGEALALALDYARKSNSLVPSDVMADLGNVNRQGYGNGLAFPRPVLDRGHLVYKDYVLFRDNDADGQFTYTAGSQTDQAYGAGIPAALSLLHIFHTMPPEFRSPRVATPGQINVNTAPPEVLRALRLLSPSNLAITGDDPWPQLNSIPHDRNNDIVASIIAYRDKIPVHARHAGGTPGLVLDFSDTKDGADVPDDEFDNNGRAYTTQIEGINETPGFRSIGELLLAHDPDNDPASGGLPPLHAIDRLAYDGADLSSLGFDAGNGTGPDGLIDEYSERFAIANGVLNTLTVRSDYFAVWFVIHGYRDEDVKGLGNDEPLIPSVARRFLMVVDRSNVTTRGDEPQVLLFKEVPY